MAWRAAAKCSAFRRCRKGNSLHPSFTEPRDCGRMPSSVDMLLAAIEHQRAARHAEAEVLYRSILAAEPGNGQALYLCGLLQLETGRPHLAAATLQTATTARPEHTGTLVNLCRALLADGRPAEALVAADRMLAVEPRNPEAAFLRGTALNALGTPALAVAAFQCAIADDPTNAAAWLNLGNACNDLDQPDDAERDCREAIRL